MKKANFDHFLEQPPCSETTWAPFVNQNSDSASSILGLVLAASEDWITKNWKQIHQFKLVDHRLPCNKTYPSHQDRKCSCGKLKKKSLSH